MNSAGTVQLAKSKAVNPACRTAARTYDNGTMGWRGGNPEARRQHPGRHILMPATGGWLLEMGARSELRAGACARLRWLRWRGGPAYGNDDRGCDCFPAVVDSSSPCDVVALLVQGHAGFGEVDPEDSLHEQYQGGALIVSSPFGALIAYRVDSPFNLNILARPYAFRRVDEMTENPSSPLASVLYRIPAVPVHAHGRTPESIAGTSTRSPPTCRSRRRPWRKANNPSLLQPLSSARAASDPPSRLEY